MVASSVIGVLAQRLVRRICDRCTIENSPTVEEMSFYAGLGGRQFNFRRGTGCAYCSHTGFRDRIGIFEMLMRKFLFLLFTPGRERSSRSCRELRSLETRPSRSRGFSAGPSQIAAPPRNSYATLCGKLPQPWHNESTCSSSLLGSCFSWPSNPRRLNRPNRLQSRPRNRLNPSNSR